MSDRTAAEASRAKIAELTDARLQALAFRVWRAAKSKHTKQRTRAAHLAPLFRAELKLRNLDGSGTAH